MSNDIATVIVPAFNSEQYLGEAIESVLAQSYPHVELVVVDDGSTDRTPEVAAGYGNRVRYFRQENAGTGAARNRGVAAAEGSTYLWFLDADDRLRQDAIALSIKALRDASAEAVYGRVVEFVSPDVPPEAAAGLRAASESTAVKLAGTMLITVEAFHRVGPWSESLRMEAVEWLARAEDEGLRWAALDEDVLERRLHLSNKGLTEGASLDYARALKAVLDRRRAAAQQEPPTTN